MKNNLIYTCKSEIMDLAKIMEYIYQNYYKLCVSNIFKRMPNDKKDLDLAQDICQDVMRSTFLAFKNKTKNISQKNTSIISDKAISDSLLKGGSLEGYLIESCKRRLVKVLKKNAKTPSIIGQNNSSQNQISLLSTTTENNENLEEILGNLFNSWQNTECEKILKNHYIHNMTDSKIAEDFGVSENTLKKRRYGCLKKMKEYCFKKGFFEKKS